MSFSFGLSKPGSHCVATRLSTAAVLLLAYAHAFAGLQSGVEYVALTQFYAAANGASWSNHAGWGSGDACQWFGVTCDQDFDPSDNTSHVIGIDVSHNNLSGSIAPISTLAHLQVFDVGSNQLSGSVPDIAGMSTLKNFYVYSNQLTGGLPGLTGLPLLIVYDADDNELTGTIPPLASLTALITFNVSNNALTGSIPDLAGLNKLSYLALSKNRLSGPIPALPPNLTYLLAGLNGLSGPVPNPPVSLSSASLCPNRLDTAAQPFDAIWNAATGTSPWWATPFAGNRCDEIFFGAFG